MALVDDFIARYRKELDFYEQAARLTAQLLERSIQSAGIRAMVTFRAKSVIRLEEKVRQRAIKKKYKNLDHVFDDVVDLAGVRVALYFPGEREQVGKIVGQLFVVDEAREFPGGTKPSYAKRFSGYWATHYRVRLRDNSLNEAQKRYADARIEIQVASVVMHAWAEVEHDLVYKPLQGRLSDDEYAILDELNGLVIAGEIALERLQRAGEKRVTAQGRVFSNHYDLAAYLLDTAAPILKAPASDGILGRVDILYRLLKQIEMASPENIHRYVASLTTDFERRPIAEQIIDQLLAENPDRYKVYERIRAESTMEARTTGEATVLDAALHNAIGRFISRWINLETEIRRLIRRKFGDDRIYIPMTRALTAMDISPAFVAEIDHIRRYRNGLVHGVEIPPADDIESATQRLESIVAKLKAVKLAQRRKRRPKKHH
jgi:ppGpp synthetase/RelA/SpoT-type nucleotidyltranferase